VSALQSGGGWLEVSVTGTELHGSATA